MAKRVTVIVEGREYIVEVGDLNESPIRATVNNRTYRVETPRQGGPASAPAEAPTASQRPVAPGPEAREQAPAGRALSGSAISAPMPGNIIEVRVRAGDEVQPGDVVCVLEAMKMNNLIYADRAGIIASVEVAAGQAVDYGAPLVTFR
jgi:biotin carboxyl carrier protein